MTVGVRLAAQGDAAAIAAIYNEGIAERSSTFETEPRHADDIRAWLQAGERVPVLVADAGEVLGWARIAPYSEREAYAGVGEVSVYVTTSARGRGIGSAMLEELSRCAEQLGYWKLVGKLFPDNEASLRLVRRNGWREVGRHLRHGRLDGEWRDVVLVERLLGQAPAPEGGAASPAA